jgi:hypothetical protein
MEQTTHIIKLRLWLFMCLFCSAVFAQSNSGAVKGTRTDKNFANTTEIHKTEKASDEQVLSEIEGEYGLGDVIHISNAPPVSVFLPSSILPSKIESVKPLALPILLPAAHFKLPKNKVKNEQNTAGNTDKPLPFSVIETGEKPEKKGDLTETLPSKSADLPTENKGEIDRDEDSFEKKSSSNLPKKTESRGSNTTVSGVEKLNTNKKLAGYNRLSSNFNTTRSHRSTTVRYDTKKSWFPFFNKKRTSKMPKTVKNKKNDRCYRF